MTNLYFGCELLFCTNVSHRTWSQLLTQMTRRNVPLILSSVSFLFSCDFRLAIWLFLFTFSFFILIFCSLIFFGPPITFSLKPVVWLFVITITMSTAISVEYRRLRKYLRKCTRDRCNFVNTYEQMLIAFFSYFHVHGWGQQHFFIAALRFWPNVFAPSICTVISKCITL